MKTTSLSPQFGGHYTDAAVLLWRYILHQQPRPLTTAKLQDMLPHIPALIIGSCLPTNYPRPGGGREERGRRRWRWGLFFANSIFQPIWQVLQQTKCISCHSINPHNLNNVHVLNKYEYVMVRHLKKNNTHNRFVVVVVVLTLFQQHYNKIY